MTRLKRSAERKNLDLDKINLETKKDLTALIFKGEKYYSDQIKEIIETVIAPESTIKVLLVAGPSSAGKTTTSNLLRLELSMKDFKSIVISLDNFYINREDTTKLPDGSYDFENLKTLDLPYLNRFINDLLKNHKAKMPIFNFVTGKRKKDFIDVVIDSHTMIIIEGLHALNPNLINNHKDEIYKIYLSLNANYSQNNKVLLPAKEIRLIRRITRDFYTRGYSVLETISSWSNVCVGEDNWVKPFKSSADYIIDSVHEYEILLYAKYTKPIIKDLILEKNVIFMLNREKDQIKKAVLINNLNKARELYYILDKAKSITKEEIPSTSLLWEFVGSAENKIEPMGKIFS